MAIVISNRIVIVMVVDSLAALPCGYFSCDHMRSFDFTHKLVLNISVKIAHSFIITCSNQQAFHCCICSLAFSLRHLVLHPGIFNIHIDHYYQVTLTPLCNKYLTWSFAELVQSMRTELRLVLLKTLRACTSRLINVLIWNNYIFFNSLDMSILKLILDMKISSINKVRRP